MLYIHFQNDYIWSFMIYDFDSKHMQPFLNLFTCKIVKRIHAKLHNNMITYSASYADNWTMYVLDTYRYN